MNRINIAIDGFSGCGKSTLARDVARSLKYTFIDSGAMYRAITYACQGNYSQKHVLKILSGQPAISISSDGDLIFDGIALGDELRTREVSSNVSKVAAIEEVREYLKNVQQALIRKKGVVMEGRDITSVIMPHAELKVFITASPQIRAERRYNQLINKGIDVDIASVQKELQERDKMDMNREHAPLTLVNDAIVLDTSNLSTVEQLRTLISIATPMIDPSLTSGLIKR
jgi:cytidylate kinase